MRALVTGAARGIGRAVARRLARDHETLILMDVDAAGLADAAKELAPLARVETVAGSVARSEDCRRAADCAAAAGGLDVLSHNAGIQRYGTVESTSEALWDEVIAVNLTGAFLISKAAMPLIRASRGTIVHMASVQGLASQAGVVAYSTAKHGLIGLVRAMAVDAAPYGVRVNGVAPGSVDNADVAGVDCARRRPGRGVGDDQGDASAGARREPRGDRGSCGVSVVPSRLVHHRGGRARRGLMARLGGSPKTE